MTNEGGPWGAPTPEPRRRGRPTASWLWFVAAVAALVLALARAFPEALRSQQDWASVAYAAGLVALVATGIFRGGRGLRRAHLGYATAWMLVAAAVALGYAYREELSGVPQHLRLAFSGGQPVATADHELVVPQDEQGGFVVVGRVNGQRVRFLVDTGASDTVLSPDDARRIGVNLDQLRFVHEAETANGKGYGAPYAARLEVGPIAFADFDLMVNQAPMTQSLLGLSFLNRLESFQVRDHKLILRWRDGG
jgi:aspartyl protease family protein